MSTNVTFNGTTYAIPAAGELNWSALSTFLIDVGTNAALTGKMNQAVRTATTTPITVVSASDFVILSKLAAPGAVACNLPAGVNGQLFFIYDYTGDAATNNITITPNGAETIGGAATLVLNHNGQGVLIQYKSADTNWVPLINHVVPGTLTDADIAALAGIARTKIASGTNYRILANSATGVMSENAALTANYPVIADTNGQLTTEQYLAGTRGGTGITSTATFPASGVVVTEAGTQDLSNKGITTDLKFKNEAVAKFYEATGGGTNYIGLKGAAALSGDVTFTLPTADGSVGQVLKTDGSAALGWASALTNPMDGVGNMIVGGTAGAPAKLATGTTGQLLIGSTGAAPAWGNTVSAATTFSDTGTGTKIAKFTSDSKLASDTEVGLMSTGTQSFGGAKTFVNTCKFNNILETYSGLFGHVISISGSSNIYNASSSGLIIASSLDDNKGLGGIIAGSTGQIIIVYKASSAGILNFYHNHASAGANDKLFMPSVANMKIPDSAYGGVVFVYTGSLWMCVASTSNLVVA